MKPNDRFSENFVCCKLKRYLSGSVELVCHKTSALLMNILNNLPTESPSLNMDLTPTSAWLDQNIDHIRRLGESIILSITAESCRDI